MKKKIIIPILAVATAVSLSACSTDARTGLMGNNSELANNEEVNEILNEIADNFAKNISNSESSKSDTDSDDQISEEELEQFFGSLVEEYSSPAAQEAEETTVSESTEEVTEEDIDMQEEESPDSDVTVTDTYYENAVEIVLSGKNTTVDGEAIGTGSSNDVYLSGGNILNIQAAGTYSLSGYFSGQIKVDLGTSAEDDSDAVVNLILDGADINCDFGPAVLFENVYECAVDADDDLESEEQSKTISTTYKGADTQAAGANIIIEKDTDNNITGSYSDDEEAAVYSKVSMNIIGADDDTSILTVSGEKAGIATEKHLTIDGGNISVGAVQEGICAHDESESCITINAGNIIVLGGLEDSGIGIHSEGHFVVNGGDVLATGSPEDSAGAQGDKCAYINGGNVVILGAATDWAETNAGAVTIDLAFEEMQDKDSVITVTDSDETEIFKFDPYNISVLNKYARAYQGAVISCEGFEVGETYHIYIDDVQQGYTGKTIKSVPTSNKSNDLKYDDADDDEEDIKDSADSIDGDTVDTDAEDSSFNIKDFVDDEDETTDADDDSDSFSFRSRTRGFTRTSSTAPAGIVYASTGMTAVRDASIALCAKAVMSSADDEDETVSSDDSENRLPERKSNIYGSARDSVNPSDSSDKTEKETTADEAETETDEDADTIEQKYGRALNISTSWLKDFCEDLGIDYEKAKAYIDENPVNLSPFADSDETQAEFEMADKVNSFTGVAAYSDDTSSDEDAEEEETHKISSFFDSSDIETIDEETTKDVTVEEKTTEEKTTEEKAAEEKTTEAKTTLGNDKDTDLSEFFDELWKSSMKN